MGVADWPPLILADKLTLFQLGQIMPTILLQVNLCQKHLFLDQLTHNMTNDCSLIYQFSTWKQQAQNMGITCCVQKLFWMSKQKQKTICVHNMFSPCSELVVFMYWTGKSMNNLLSYVGLVDEKIRASDKVYLYLVFFILKSLESIFVFWMIFCLFLEESHESQSFGLIGNWFVWTLKKVSAESIGIILK